MISMKILRLLLLVLMISGCGTASDDAGEPTNGFDYAKFEERFRETKLPYTLTDTGLIRNKDTAAIRDPRFLAWITDSIQRKMFGKTTGIRWIPLVKINAEDESYFITKGVSGNKTGALLTVFDKDNAYGASMPLLLPDNDPASSQVAAIDRQLSISKTTVSKLKYDVIVEGKDVFIYNRALKGFTLIITDELNEENNELFNAIDTLGKKHKYAGDYTRNKNN